MSVIFQLRVLVTSIVRIHSQVLPLVQNYTYRIYIALRIVEMIALNLIVLISCCKIIFADALVSNHKNTHSGSLRILPGASIGGVLKIAAHGFNFNTRYMTKKYDDLGGTRATFTCYPYGSIALVRPSHSILGTFGNGTCAPDKFYSPGYSLAPSASSRKRYATRDTASWLDPGMNLLLKLIISLSIFFRAIQLSHPQTLARDCQRSQTQQ